LSSPAAFDFVKNDLLLVEEKMRSQADQDYSVLQAALNHLLLSGGKRTRPTLTLLTGRMLGGKLAQLVTLAAAIEMLHTATLVHDDLIDGALLRRGIPTINSQWSPAATVLTGDYLFARAAKLAAEADSLPAMRLFSETLAVIVNGEIGQMFSKRLSELPQDRPMYYQRIHAKTASLFETSAAVAAMVSPVNDSVIEAVSHFGHQVGMAFQIVDDILDFTGSQETVGKPVGSDLRQGLVTLPTIIYLESLKTDQERKSILQSIENQEIVHVDGLVESIRSSEAIAQALREGHAFVEQAVCALNTLPFSPERQALEELAWFIVEREV